MILDLIDLEHHTTMEIKWPVVLVLVVGGYLFLSLSH